MVTRQSRAGAAFGVAHGFRDRENRQGRKAHGRPFRSGISPLRGAAQLL